MLQYSLLRMSGKDKCLVVQILLVWKTPRASFTSLLNFGVLCWQKEFEANKPARDAAAKAKAEADAEEASRAAEVPLHSANEWNIR